MFTNGWPPQRDGAVSFTRVLGGGENPTPDARREFDNSKETGRVEVILTRLIDHPKLPKLRGLAIGNHLIELPTLERSLVASIPQAKHQLTRARGHINQDNA